MTTDRWLDLVARDWGEAWDTLEPAPDWAHRPKTSQVTLRVSSRLLGRLKAVAGRLGLPYHAAARSWILESLRAGPAASPELGDDAEGQSEQLNLKVDQDFLDALKIAAHAVRRPYHRLARELIAARLASEEERLGLTRAPRLPLKDLMVLLLHAGTEGPRGAVQGITRLQKLLFVIDQKLGSTGTFYAYHYGPFSEEVNDAASSLRLAGLLEGGSGVAQSAPSFAEMMSTVLARSGPSRQFETERFALSKHGHEVAERLRHSSAAYEALYEQVVQLRTEWDKAGLLDRVYEDWPEYTDRSLIRDQVVKRRARRRR